MAEIRTFFLSGPVGRLEAILNAGSPQAKYAALVCHPHPLHGGTMHNKVVYHAMKALHGLGLPVLRFNFRGAGLSEGGHNEGSGERGDVRAALDWLEGEFHLPILFAGFSFGAAVGLKTCCHDPRVEGLISLGTPVTVLGRAYTYGYLNDCTKPKLMVSGSNDEFGPVANLQAVFEAAALPKELVLVEGADHFFVGKLPRMMDAVAHWVDRYFPSARVAPASVSGE